MSTLRFAWQALRNEGVSALCDRLLDRLAWQRQRRQFRLVARVDAASDSVPRLSSVPVLHLLPTSPRRDFGGVQIQLLRRLAAARKLGSWAWLYPEAGGYRLEAGRDDRQEAIFFVGAAPPDALSTHDAAFAVIVERAAACVDARILHCEQPYGLPLASLTELRRQERRLVVSVHDFGLFCLRPHLLEAPSGEFCEYCRDLARCARCLGQSWSLPEGFQAERRRQATALLAAADVVIFPSDFLRRAYQELMPGRPASRRRVIPLTAAGEGGVRRRQRRREKSHIAFVGAFKPHKGAHLLLQLLERFSGERWPRLRWSLYGGGDGELLRRARRHRRLRVRGYYRADELPGLLRRDRVDVALLLSIVPESYGLTCDECLRAGVDIVAFDHGAVADRLRRHGAGVLVAPEGGVEAVTRVLTGLLTGTIGSSQVAGEPLPSAASVAAAHQQIYSRLLAEIGDV